MAEALDSFLSAKLSVMRSDSGGNDAIIAAEGPDFSDLTFISRLRLGRSDS
jgi:hypothetical protein